MQRRLERQMPHDLEEYFRPYRMQTIGINHYFDSPYGKRKILYADWTASGRLYRPIELKLMNEAGPLYANTHTDSNITASTTTAMYDAAKHIIKQHVHADKHDVLIMDGPGMTSVVNKLQRILGLRVSEPLKDNFKRPAEQRPVIFVTHMEHHSNQISWAETIGDVVPLQPADDGGVNTEQLAELLRDYRDRPLKIGAFTACSNVTGITTPYHKLARIMHEHGGICFIDFSASAPYVEIDMHPKSPLEKLDGIFFSPHKFLGGPGSAGVLVFDSRLYPGRVPDKPGGGTVSWTDPWGGVQYLEEPELREDGGTPGILQAAKAALAIKLKEQMGSHNLLQREKKLTDILLSELENIPKLHILAGDRKDRLGIISFWVEDIHYNLIVKLLNDRFGIQVRGGCSCAGTYGHHLLQIDRPTSSALFNQIMQGDQSLRPGWVRVSLHPIMTDEEVHQIALAVRQTVANATEWQKDYIYNRIHNSFSHRKENKPPLNSGHFFG